MKLPVLQVAKAQSAKLSQQLLNPFQRDPLIIDLFLSKPVMNNEHDLKDMEVSNWKNRMK